MRFDFFNSVEELIETFPFSRYFITDNGCRSLEECVLKKNCLIPNHMTAMCQLAGAVNWYHEKGMVHGDICPENIFIYEDYFNKCETREKLHLKLGLPYVKNGDGYGDLTKEADCYSVGLLLFFMLTGKHPFQMGKSESEIEMNMRKNRFNLDGDIFVCFMLLRVLICCLSCRIETHFFRRQD